MSDGNLASPLPLTGNKSHQYEAFKNNKGDKWNSPLLCQFMEEGKENWLFIIVGLLEMLHKRL